MPDTGRPAASKTGASTMMLPPGMPGIMSRVRKSAAKGVISSPSRASFAAGASSSRQGRLPRRRCASKKPATVPGVRIEV